MIRIIIILIMFVKIRTIAEIIDILFCNRVNIDRPKSRNISVTMIFLRRKAYDCDIESRIAGFIREILANGTA